MKTYILQSENNFYLAKEEEVTILVEDVQRATKFNYNDASYFSNLHFQISDVKTTLIDADSDKYFNLIADSFNGLSEQIYKNEWEIDYDSRY